MKKILTFVLAALASVATFAGTLSCAEAVELAQGLEPNTPSEEEYIVEGYVVSVIKSSATDLRFWMADDAAAELGTFEAWMCTGDVVNKGDKVTVTGNIQWYVNQKNPEDQKAEIYGGVVVVVEPAPIDENYVEFIASDFEGKGVSSTGGEISVTKNGVTVYTNGGFGASYSLRVYKNKQFKISADRRIISIAFEFDNYDGDYSGGLDPEVCVEGTEWEVASMAAQARFKKISVTLGDGECSVTPVEIPIITVTEALEIGRELQPAENKSVSTTEKYDVRGYIVGISEKKENTFYLADVEDAYGEFQAYQCASVVGTAAEGAYVSIVGKISNYHGVSGEGKHYNNIEISGGDLTVIWGAALENVKAASKAVKTIENGQFVIEANGVRYNVLGTAL